jgi:hypothetical protein
MRLSQREGRRFLPVPFVFKEGEAVFREIVRERFETVRRNFLQLQSARRTKAF